MLVDRVPAQHVGRGWMQSIQPNAAKHQKLRRWFGVLLLSDGPRERERECERDRDTARQ